MNESTLVLIVCFAIAVAASAAGVGAASSRVTTDDIVLIGDSFAVGLHAHMGVRGRAVTGSTALDWIDKVGSLVRPGTVLVVSVGTNDCLKDGSLCASLAKHSAKLVSNAVSAGASRVVFLLPGWLEPSWLDRIRAGLNRHERIFYSPSQKHDVSGDRIHLTYDGYRRWSDAIRRCL